VLFKMLNQGVFSSINGCISTGKEANVYHAVTSEGNHLAVKVCARAWDAMGGGS
jgi:RIO kinase 1